MAATDFRIVLFVIVLSWFLVEVISEDDNEREVKKFVGTIFDLVEDGTGRSMKLKRLFLPLLLALKVKLATVILVGVTTIAIVSATTVLANLGTLFLSGLTLLTSAADHHPKRTITIASHPEVAHHHWDREESNGQQPDAYFAHQPDALTSISSPYDESH